MSATVKILLTIQIFLWLANDGFAQGKFHIIIEPKGRADVSLATIEGQYIDSVSVIKIIDKLIQEKALEGFLLANLDELQFKNDTAFATIYIGKKYESMDLIADSTFQYPHKNITSKRKGSIISLRISDLKSTFKKIIAHYENNGYPFAMLKLDSIKKNDDGVSAKMDFNVGPLILFDSLKVRGDEVIKYSFLSNYLGIERGKAFDQSKVDNILSKMDRLNYVSLKEQPNVNFRLGMGEVDLNIEPQKVNTFDGIAGILPGKNGVGSRLTGELKLSFDNLFKSGKKIDFEWQKLNDESQFLDASYAHPRLLHSPLNFSFNYNQLKEDTLFSNRSFKLGFDYDLFKRLNLSLTFENKEGNNINESSTGFGDFTLNLYTLGLNWRNLDDIQFPKNGFSLKATASVGAKSTILPTNANITSNQYEFTGQVEQYKKLSKRNVFHAKLSSGFLSNEQLFINDLFRIGGLSTLRGFNEKLFFASRFGLVNLESRWLMSQDSYFLIFIDQAILSYNVQGQNFNDNPTGIGIGMKIKTGSGYFNMVYGLGRTKNQNFSFNFSKIHFGYVATL